MSNYSGTPLPDKNEINPHRDNPGHDLYFMFIIPIYIAFENETCSIILLKKLCRETLRNLDRILLNGFSKGKIQLLKW